MYQFDDRPPAGNIKLDIDRLRRLARDLERARQGENPGERELDRAPLIDNWQFAYRAEICLVGIVKGTSRNRRRSPQQDVWPLAALAQLRIRANAFPHLRSRPPRSPSVRPHLI